MKERRCVIISGGDEEKIGDVRGAFVIGCDRGCLYAERQGIRPDLCVGDFDSYGGPLPDGAPVVRLPQEKDDTDTMYAMRYAVENGFDRADITCAFGGRLDHTLANLETAVFGAKAGLIVTLSGNGERAAAFGPSAGVVRIPRREGYSLSVFAGCGEARGVTIKGTKYEIENGALSASFPLGASNEWARDEASVSVSEGTLLVITSRKTDG
ncbi:MAG: thiamine diphosphokinase [Clostridia bacterium]|nr:thiamine diphosphokinase [Clostridia bacterium]MBR7032971.1 thiamine diphosphokinase [Clostridia bacterium]